MVLKGTDSKGNLLQRTDPAVVATSSVTVSVAMDTSGGFSVTPGESVNVNITLTNNGTADTYTLNISDSEGFYEDVEPSV